MKGTMVRGGSRVYQDLDVPTDTVAGYNTALFPPDYFHHAILVFALVADCPEQTTEATTHFPMVPDHPNTTQTKPSSTSIPFVASLV